MTLAERYADLGDQPLVVDQGGVRQRALPMPDRGLGLAEAVIDIAEPVARPGHGGLVPAPRSELDRAVEHRNLVARRIEHAGTAEALRDPAPAIGDLVRWRQPVQRRQRRPVLRLRAVERRNRDRLVAGQLGMARGRRPILAGAIMVSERLVRLLLARLPARSSKASAIRRCSARRSFRRTDS